MPEKAHVTSVDAIAEFRANLVHYVSKARPTLEEVSSDVVRMRVWLQNDQRMALEALVRRRTKELEQAQAALSSARLAVFRQDNSAEQRAVQRARRALEEAETKLKRLKQWNREFDTRVEPLVRQLEKLHTVLANDMVQAAAHLTRVLETLSSYAELNPAAAPGGSIQPATPTEAAAPSSEPSAASIPAGGKP
jgi:chromosome segregation ATPase